MVLLMLLGVALIGVLCVLAYALAIYALPFMLGLTAARLAYETGAGFLGAGVVGLIAGAAAWGVLVLLFNSLRSPVLRLLVALIFAVPAAVAGYLLVHGIAREAVPSEVWRQVFCIVGGAVVGLAAFGRLVAPVPPTGTTVATTDGLVQNRP